MNISFSRKAMAAAILAAVTLTGCASGPGMQHRQHHAGTAASQERMGGGMGTGMMMSDTDMQSMCGMHMNMMRAKTPEERKAMMAEHMKTMSPQMMQKHMEMMQMQMQMMQEHMKAQGSK